MNDLTYLGETTWHNEHRRFGIKLADRRQHMMVLGQTGVGKSTLLSTIALSDILSGGGCAVVDPHGQLVEDLMNYIPDERIADVIYLNPLDIERPVPLNPLENVNPAYHHLVVAGVISIFKKLFEKSWGDNLERILRNALFTLMNVPGATLRDVPRLLLDKDFRQRAVGGLTDKDLIRFWREEYDRYSEVFRAERLAPVLNKVDQFLVNPLLKAMVGQPKNTFDVREAMDSGKIILVNLARGMLGEDASALLGSMVITRLWLAALSRQDIPEAERRDFPLIVDEAHYLPGSFTAMLSETRKYRLNVTLAFQYLEQLDEAFRAALFGNVGTLLSFRTGATDAEVLAKQFYPTFRESDFVNLPAFELYVKLLIDGAPSKGFSARTVPLEYPKTGNKAAILSASRERYGRAPWQPAVTGREPQTASPPFKVPLTPARGWRPGLG